MTDSSARTAGNSLPLTVVCGPAGAGRALAAALVRHFADETEPHLLRGSQDSELAGGIYGWTNGEIHDYVPAASLGPVANTGGRLVSRDPSVTVLVRDAEILEDESVLDLMADEQTSSALFITELERACGIGRRESGLILRTLGPAFGLIPELGDVQSRFAEMDDSELIAACLALPTVNRLRDEVVSLGSIRLLDLGRVLCLLRPMEIEVGDEWAQLASSMSGSSYAVSDLTVILHDFPGLFRVRVTDDGQRFVRPAGPLATKLLLGHVMPSESEHFSLFQALRGRSLSILERTDSADQFIAEQVPRQAAAASALTELLSDPIAILCSDPMALLEEIERDPRNLSFPGAKTTLLAAHRLIGGIDRASHLELSALRLGLEGWAEKLDREIPRRRWRPLWAEAEATHAHRTLVNHRAAALVVTHENGGTTGRAFGGFSDGSIWAMHPRLPARLLISPTVLGGEIRALTAAFVRQQSLVACGTSAHAVAVFDGDTGDLMWRDSDRYTDPLSTIAIEAGVDRGRIFTGGVGGDIAVHDLFTGKHPAEPLHRHGVEIRDLVVVQGPGGSSVIVFCAVDGTVGVVHAETGQQLLTWRVEEEVLNSVDANVEQDDLVIVVGSASGRVICRTLPLKLLESTGLVRLTGDDGDVTDIARHELAVNCVRFMGTGEQLQVLSASTDTTWRLTNVADARGRPGVGHVGPVWSIDAVSVEGRTYVYTAGGEGTCRLWLIESVEEDLEFARSARHHGPVTSIFLLPGDVHGRVTALTGGGDGGVRITTSAKAAGSRTVLHHGAEISAVMCVPSSDRSDSLDVISGSTDGALHLTELGEEGYSASQVLGIVHEGVTTLSKGMIGGSQHVISGGLDGTISIWDLDKRAPKATVRACQYGSVQALCHVDARGEGAVVAGGQDGTLSLRVGIALEERRCSRLPTSILCLSAFPGSGMWFVAGLTDGRLAIVRELGPHAENIQYVEASETEIRGVAAMLIGDRLVVAATGLDRRLRLFDATSGTEMLQIELDGYALTLAANETRIALGTTAGAMVATFPVDPLLLTMPT